MPDDVASMSCKYKGGEGVFGTGADMPEAADENSVGELVDEKSSKTSRCAGVGTYGAGVGLL